MALSLSESDTNGDRCLLRTDPPSPRRSAFLTGKPFLPLDWLIAGDFPLFGFLQVSLLVFVLARLCYRHETLRGVEVTTSLSNMATVTASLQFSLLSLLRAVIISGDVRSISFLRLVAVMVLVLTTVTTKHHLHLSLVSDPQSEVHSSHGVLLDSGFVEYVPALLAGCLVLLTFVSNVLVSGRHDLLWAFRRLSQILSDLICNCRPARKPPWDYWAEMAFEKAMGMILHLQEGVRRRHNTSSVYFLQWKQSWGRRLFIILCFWIEISRTKERAKVSLFVLLPSQRYHYVVYYISELQIDTLSSKRFAKIKFSHVMLHSNRLREKSNLKLENSSYSEWKASSNSTVFFLVYGTYNCVCKFLCYCIISL